MKNKFYIFNAIAISIFALFSAMNLVVNNGEYSYLENRYLQSAPEISFESIKDRSFMEEAEDYSNDQLMFRDTFVKTKAFVEKLTGKKENNGVYFAKDGYIIEKPAELNEELIAKNIESAKIIGEMGRFDVTFCLIPQAFEIHKEKLPAGAYHDAIAKLNEKVNAELSETDVKNTDVLDLLKMHKNDEIFYRTDHHQTSLGSYLVYKELGEQLDYRPLGVGDFKVDTVSDSFLGTTYSKGLVNTGADEIKAYSTEISRSATVEFYGEGKTSESIFFPEHLGKKDQYSYFLDGNHGVTVVKSSLENGRKIALFKDSYAHSLTPFLINHFESIHLIDMRYFGEDPIKYLTDNEITEILFLYGSSTFMTDETIGKTGEYGINSPYAKFGLVKECDAVGNEYFSDAVFLGDSITMGFQAYSGITEAQYACSTAMSVGGVFNIGDDGRSLVEKVRDAAPGKIYILLGANELLSADNKENVINKFITLVDTLKEDVPGAIIYIQSILPVSEEKENDSYLKNDVIASYNESLMALAEEKQIYFIDINNAVSDSRGYLIDELTWDGVHLGEEGCKLWAEYLKTHAIGGESASVEALAEESGEKELSMGKYNLEEMAEKLKEEVTFEGDVGKTSPETLIITHGVNEESVSYACGYIGGGATTEEIALFEANSESEAEEIKAALKDYIESRKKSFESYIPKEVPKLNNAVLYSEKELVVLVIASETNDAENLLEDIIE